MVLGVCDRGVPALLRAAVLAGVLAGLLNGCGGGGQSPVRTVSTSLRRSPVLTSSTSSRTTPTVPSGVERVSGGSTGTYVVPPGIHKIRHVIIVMQENRSFDSYFGTYPGADGIPMSSGAPTVCVPDLTGGCVQPYHDTADINGGGPHGAANAIADIDGGRMDGFVSSARERARPATTLTTRLARTGSRRT